MTRNLELWLEMMEQHKVFEDEDSRHHKYANEFIEGMMKGNNLTQRDLICLQGLIACIVDHTLEHFEEHGTRC